MTHSNNGIKRVIFISNVIGRLGGVTTVVNTLSGAFIERGIDVEYISMVAPEEGLIHKTKNVRILEPGKGKTIHNPLSSKNPGFLHIKYILKWMYTKIWDAKNSLNLHKIFSDMSDSDLVIFVDPFPALASYNTLKRLKNQKNRATICTAFHSSFYSAGHELIRNFLPKVIEVSDHFILLSKEDAKLFSQEYNTKAIFIENPVNKNCNINKTNKDDILSTITRFSKGKNIDKIINAFNKISPSFPSWELHVYGEGDELPAVQRELDLAQNSNIHLHPPIPAVEVDKVLAQSKLGIMTSDFEGLPMFILESMAAKTPVVSTPSSPAVVDIIGKYGYLTDDMSLDAIEEKLYLAMKDNRLRESKAQEAYEKSQEFSPEAIAQKWLDLKR